jgi:hypothetical protein
MWYVRRGKPRVSAFASANIDKILAPKPDLILTFSDLQADIAADLIRRGLNVHAFNQRTDGLRHSRDGAKCSARSWMRAGEPSSLLQLSKPVWSKPGAGRNACPSGRAYSSRSGMTPDFVNGFLSLSKSLAASTSSPIAGIREQPGTVS